MVVSRICRKPRQWIADLKLTFRSLTYNHFLDQSYVADTLMEPLFWFVENFTKFLGPFFVAAVCALTTFVVGVAYYLGLPYWWSVSPAFTIILLIIGHWLLINVVFNFYMACITSPGHPPQGQLIPEAVSICKKCITPKPPRTHHCSICDRCVLKMDHHCPWLNNCVGHFNHRYFFMYMVYVVTGCLYIILFGFNLGWAEVFGDGAYLQNVQEVKADEELIGHPVRFNHSKLIPMRERMPNGSFHPLPDPFIEPEIKTNATYRNTVIFVSLVVSGVFFALGTLAYWHLRIIGRGETSIEYYINKAETKRYSDNGIIYKNPYDFGLKANWKIFLGLIDGRGWRHVLLPSRHLPKGTGLSWETTTFELLLTDTAKQK
ncbi:palmitoyltransferase ZDHHC16 isoform X2 [Neocloeon triangulifer]|nr:palmitoyltransferase ZDHHC16 isoform X2 [Neocloeon triangulifer]XP_059477667.1 palmitoyltransferase ZDHHC16 isoform X2 [Neocloeon triangulifer]